MRNSFRKEIDEHPENGYAYLYLAHIQQHNEEYGKALSSVDNALKYIPKKDKEVRVFAHGMKSDVYYELGETDKAIEQLNQCLAVGAGIHTIVVYEQRARMYFEKKLYGLAEKDCESIIAIDEGNVIGYMGLGRLATVEGRYDDAIKQFEQPVLAYAPSPGIPELIDAIRGYYRNNRRPWCGRYRRIEGGFLRSCHNQPAPPCGWGNAP